MATVKLKAIYRTVQKEKNKVDTSFISDIRMLLTSALEQAHLRNLY